MRYPAGGDTGGGIGGGDIGAASSPAAAGSSATCVGISPGEHGGVGAGATRAFKKIKVGEPSNLSQGGEAHTPWYM